jgi:amphi-Trp domain-containing protein
MSDVEISRTESLTRHEAARRLNALADALAGDGRVEVELGASMVKLHVPDHVRCEVEVEVDGDEVELEVELTWSTASATPAATSEPAAEPAAAKPDRARAGKAAARA